MELSRNPDWRLTKSLLIILGLWPFQKTYCRKFLSCVAIVSIISILIPEVIKIINVWGDVSAVAECAPMLFLHLQSMIKLLSYYFYSSKLKIILEDIQRDWLSDLSFMEIGILKNYGERNRRVTYAYAWVILGCTITITGTPLAQKVLDYIAPLNETRTIEFLYSVEYFVDLDKYKKLLFIHAYLISPFPSLVTIAFDTTYFHCVQHGCSMFSIIRTFRRRMRMITDQTDIQTCGNRANNRTHRLLSDLIRRHVITLRYCEKLESLHTVTLIPIIIINTLALSITGFHTLIKLNDPPEAFKYGSFTCGCVVHLFFYTYSGQDLTDHSQSIHQFMYNSEWYNMSPEVKIFFILAMIRSDKSCKMTAGKLYIFSLENFGKVLKLSVSYFTVLLSLQ